MFRYVAIDDTDQWAENIQKLGKVYLRYVYDDTQTYDGERRLYFVGYYLTFDGDADEDTMEGINESEGDEEDCIEMDKEEADDLKYLPINAEDIEEAREYCRGHMFLPFIAETKTDTKTDVTYPYSVVRFDDTENWGDYDFPEGGKIYSRYVFDSRKILDGRFRLLHFADFVTDFHPTQKQLDYIKEIAAAETDTLILEDSSVVDGEFEPSLGGSSCIEEAVACCRKTSSRIISKSRPGNKDVIEVTFDNKHFAAKTFFLNEKHEVDPLVNKENSFDDFLADPDSRQVLRDALGEFITMRTPIDEYIRNRYEGQTPKFLKDKLVEVEKRVAIAEEMRKKL